MKIRDLDNVRKDDKIIHQTESDTRKPKLTLRHLNRLRKMREVRSLEKIYQRDQLEAVYGAGGETEE
jgi:hypothetical protein